MKLISQFNISGSLIIGQREVMSTNEGDILSTHDFYSEGYKKTLLLDNSHFEKLRQVFASYLISALQQENVMVDEHFNPEKYHEYVQDEVKHRAIAKWCLPVNALQELTQTVMHKVESILGKPLKVRSIDTGSGTKEDILGFRIIRPKVNDSTPFHRDAWLDIWKRTIIVWVPLYGCDINSTLAVIPGSHLWYEDEVAYTGPGSLINGNKYKVPSAVCTSREFSIIYPNPGYGEALIFTPYLLHGGGENNNSATTRISLEFRFEEA